MLQREHEILQKLQGHPNIIKSFGINLDGVVVAKEESENIMYNVLEHAKNGAFSNFVRNTGGIEEEITRFYVTQLWNALDYIHQNGYAHLDIKLENILLDEFFNIKVADMGSWTSFAENGLTDKRRGTLLYMAPEVVNLQKDETFDAKAADIYSLGITIFVMLTGEFPSEQYIQNNLYTCESDQKTSCDIDMESEDEVKSRPDFISKEVKYLIKQMLNPDPTLRPTISQVLSYPWLNNKFEPIMSEVVYSEMNSRNEFMLSNTKDKSMIW